MSKPRSTHPRLRNQKLQPRNDWYNLSAIQYVHILKKHQSLQKMAQNLSLLKIITVIIMRKINSNQLKEQISKVLEKDQKQQFEDRQLLC